MFKRILDVILAFLFILFFSPVYFVVFLFIFLKMGRPIFFRQQRPGKDGKIFSVYKFRTMTNEKDRRGVLLADELRLSGFGKFIRSVSLDELPQVFNVIKGEMSFVGPRPLLVEYLSLYSDRQKKRHNVMPGITGWAQVNGRNTISWELKFEYDVWYVEHQSFWLDMKILFLTFLKVIKRRDIDSISCVSMKKFRGSE